MPVVIVVFLALCGLGYFARDAEAPAPVAKRVPLARSVQHFEAAHKAWTADCKAHLDEATRGFEQLAAPGCADHRAGVVSVSQLSSGVEYVEYNLHTVDGVDYQISVTEEPDNDNGGGEGAGWRSAIGCRGYEHGVEVVRHEHGRLARVYAAPGGRALEFARLVESAANRCVESPE